MSHRTSKPICVQQYYVHRGQAWVSKAGETGCTQTPFWGHPLCGHKASFSSLFGRHSSCQPAVGTSFRAEDWWCDLRMESWRSWSALGSARGLLTPPPAPAALGLEHSVYPGEGSGEWCCWQETCTSAWLPQPPRARGLQRAINGLNVTAGASCCIWAPTWYFQYSRYASFKALLNYCENTDGRVK